MNSASPSSITVRLLLFATYADLTGQHEVTATLNRGAKAADLVAWARSVLPQGSRIPEKALVAINRRHVKLDHALESGDEVALLPPMAGG